MTEATVCLCYLLNNLQVDKKREQNGRKDCISMSGKLSLRNHVLEGDTIRSGIRFRFQVWQGSVPQFTQLSRWFQNVVGWHSVCGFNAEAEHENPKKYVKDFFLWCLTSNACEIWFLLTWPHALSVHLAYRISHDQRHPSIQQSRTMLCTPNVTDLNVLYLSLLNCKWSSEWMRMSVISEALESGL